VRALRDERLRQGISMERLAEKAGLSQGTISLVERDLRNPTLDTLLRVAEVLKVDLGRVIQQSAAEVSKVKKP
jgi:transcriptional regulator with XRE-family HTH domain